MERALGALRFLFGLVVPGGVLVVAAWAFQREDVVRDYAANYATYFASGSLAAAVLLSWYYDQCRLLCSASAVALALLPYGPLTAHADELKLAGAILLPLNLALFGLLKERGVITFDGVLKMAAVAVQAAGVYRIASDRTFDVQAAGIRATWPGGGTELHWLAQVSFAVGAVVLLSLVFKRRTRVEQGLLWTLVAMVLGLTQYGDANATRTHDLLFLYSGAAGLILVFGVLEHGYDIAYRDELTGLPGRRAFNAMMEQLSGVYAIAMCDVDHFKKFNDTYGHDAGDQVLRKVAARLSQVGGGGRTFRYGGEEFLIVFRGRTARQAEPFVESLRRDIADEGFFLRDSNRPALKPRADGGHDPLASSRVNISVSVGLAERSKRHSTPELVLDAADATLYRAKTAGRNCVLLDDTPS